MSDIDPQEARSTADEILSRPEFSEESPTLIDRLADWLFDRMNDFFAVAFGGNRGLWFGYLLLGLGVTLALYFLVRHFPWGRLRPSEELAGVETDVVGGRSPDRAEWLAVAREAEQAGQWSRAVYARYRAMTAGLAAANELRADDSATSGEYRTEFAEGARAEPDRVASFGGATDRFEHVWFGGEPAAEPDVEVMAEADRIVLRSARPES